jgi:hypothetical protein
MKNLEIFKPLKKRTAAAFKDWKIKTYPKVLVLFF